MYEDDDDNEPLPQPHPAFAAHFTDPLYEDAGEDLAPFGSDEGFELLVDAADRRAEIAAQPTLANVLECAPDDVATLYGPMVGPNGMDTAAFVTSGAFVLLRLAGRIGEDDRDLAIAAIDLTTAHVLAMNPEITETPSELVTMRRDLLAWTNPSGG